MRVGQLVPQESESPPDQMKNDHGNGEAHVVDCNGGLAPIEERVNPKVVGGENNHCVCERK